MSSLFILNATESILMEESIRNGWWVWTGRLKRNWQALIALVGSVSICVLAIVDACAGRCARGSDWLGLAIYLCGAAVFVAETEALRAAQASPHTAVDSRVIALPQRS
jgi:hypothetical protein